MKDAQESIASRLQGVTETREPTPKYEWRETDSETNKQKESKGASKLGESKKSIRRVNCTLDGI